MDKRRLRQELKSHRQKLSNDDVAKLSKTIIKQLVEILDLSSIESLHTYLPIKGQKEVDTRLLLKHLWQKYPKIKTATWDSGNQNAKAVWLDSRGNKELVPEEYQFGVIIVPLLGFNQNNHRLGFGGGFYDRFLATQPKALKIGLGYQIGFIKDGLPHQKHDIALDKVITEI